MFVRLFLGALAVMFGGFCCNAFMMWRAWRNDDDPPIHLFLLCGVTSAFGMTAAIALVVLRLLGYIA